MTGSDNTPSRGDVRRILAAAADVLFSDGVPAEFLDQWADETVFLLSAASPHAVHHLRRPG